MKVIIDTNIIIAALIKEGITREIILNDEMKFYTPAHTFSEIRKYADTICKKAKITHDEIEIILKILFEQISIISEYKEYIEKSKKLISDPEDTPIHRNIPCNTSRCHMDK